MLFVPFQTPFKRLLIFFFRQNNQISSRNSAFLGRTIISELTRLSMSISQAKTYIHFT